MRLSRTEWLAQAQTLQRGFHSYLQSYHQALLFPQKKKTILLVGNAPPHHLQIKALHISDLNKIKYSTNFAWTEGWRLQAEEA